MRFIIIIIILIMMFSFSFLKKEKPWHILNTEAFEISFPKEPVLDTNLLNSDIGILKIYSYILDTSSKKSSKNKLYSLVHIDYPSDLIHSSLKDQLNGIFRNAIDVAVGNVQGKLLTEQKTSIGGYPGRIVEIDFQEGFAIVLMHCYLIENTMYILQTISETSKYSNNHIERFIQSFKLVH